MLVYYHYYSTVITAIPSLSVTVQFIPAVEEEWQVVSVTSGRIYGGGAEVTRRRNNKGPLLRTPGNVLCSVSGARGAKTSTCVQGGGWRGACALVRVAIP